MSWADIPYARLMWPDAPKVDATLQGYLDAAHGPCLAYAPALPVTDPPTPTPEAYKLAEVMQARELWQAARRDGDVIGFDDGSAVRARPLSTVAKVLLRPPTPATGLVG